MSPTSTPMLRQFEKIKARHRDCILFYRLGDFYEMFGEDAKVAAKILDLVLTARGKGSAHETPMCGIPYHAAEGYIARLIKAGKKVAICEQVQDPSEAKGIVERDVIRVITAGTYLDENSTDARYILCLSPQGKKLGLAFIDPSTGNIQTNEYSSTQKAVEILARLPVCEIVYPIGSEDTIKTFLEHPLLKTKSITLSPHEDWCFNEEIAHKTLCEHFELRSLAGFGIEELPTATSSAGSLLEYLRQMNKTPLKHIDRVSLYADEEYVFISPAATYGLELDTLFKTINHTRSAMGKRRLRYWLFHPLRKPSDILQRQAAVHLLREDRNAQEQLKDLLTQLPDLEKSISKLSCGYCQPRDLLAVRNALSLIPDLQNSLQAIQNKNRLFEITDIPELRSELEKAINPDMPLAKNEGKVIRSRYHTELDELKSLQETGRQFLADYQAREIKRSGINSLKIGYNKVFGYYIEVSKANIKNVPADFIRKQTLVNGERFITPELKEYEEKILSAQDKVLKIENELIRELQTKILDHSVQLHAFAEQTALIDALYSLSHLANQKGWVAPEIDDDVVIDIKDGRHPVVEQTSTEAFVPNDTYLDNNEQHLIILTGPNMAGKSTYIRQIAVLIILAQMGGFVPAAKAKIGAVDKIFTRIGAHDDITRGHSTFMVEMTEAADILNNLSNRSLVILDEIGRGTSTFDGLSLAWALVEHLQKTKARALFATHFHELTSLAENNQGIKNFNVAVKEWKDEIIFLHIIIPGSSDDSYGIYVAKLAGVPNPVIDRAKKILTRLELNSNLSKKITGEQLAEDQLSLFASQADPAAEKIIEILKTTDVNSLTPIEALNRLQKLKDISEN